MTKRSKKHFFKAISVPIKQKQVTPFGDVSFTNIPVTRPTLVILSMEHQQTNIHKTSGIIIPFLSTTTHSNQKPFKQR